MKTLTARLKSLSPYSQSRAHDTSRECDEAGRVTETWEDWRKRTWREHCHVDERGFIFIPPMTFKNCLSEAAKYRAMKIPDKGKSTYTKHFEAGVMVLEGLTLPIHKDKVEHENLFLPSDGRRGSGTRVWKRYPVIRAWEGDVIFHVLDDVITAEVFRQHLESAGNFIGIGRFRPRNNGYYGRFIVESLKAAS